MAHCVGFLGFICLLVCLLVGFSGEIYLIPKEAYKIKLIFCRFYSMTHKPTNCCVSCCQRTVFSIVCTKQGPSWQGWRNILPITESKGSATEKMPKSCWFCTLARVFPSLLKKWNNNRKLRETLISSWYFYDLIFTCSFAKLSYIPPAVSIWQVSFLTVKSWK